MFGQMVDVSNLKTNIKHLHQPVICLLNGPPECGKDTLGGLLEFTFANASIPAYRAWQAKWLKDLTHKIYNIHKPWNYYEGQKDTRLPEFHGDTPREAYIWLSEKILKPKFGKDIFGNILATSIAEATERDSAKVNNPIFFICDTGFAEECIPLKPLGELFLFRIWRKGKDFKGDSRNYISLREQDHEFDVHQEENRPQEAAQVILHFLETRLKDKADFA